MQTLTWLTQAEAEKDPLLKAIWEKPGISRTELLERKLITRSKSGMTGDRLVTLAVDGKVIPKDGGYYPYLPEHLPATNRRQPPLKVWRDPNIIESPGQAVAKAIATAVRSCAVRPEPNRDRPAVEVSAVTVSEPDQPEAKPRKPYDKTIRRQRVARQQQQIRAIAAELEREGQPFTLNAVMVRAGVGTGYLYKPIHQELRAEIEAAIARVEAKFSPDQIDIKRLPTAKRTSMARRRVMNAIAQLEEKGQPFSRSDVTELAGIGRGYFSQNQDMRELADKAIARCMLKHLTVTSETVSEAQNTPLEVGMSIPTPQEVYNGIVPPGYKPDPVVTALSDAQARNQQAIDELSREKQEIAAELERVNREIRQLEATEKSLIENQRRCDRLLGILQGGGS